MRVPLVVSVVFNQQVVFFQSFLIQRTAFITVLQSRSINWIVSVKQFPLEISIYHSAKPECVQLFHWCSELNPRAYYSHNNGNTFQLHLIIFQEQSYFALTHTQNSPSQEESIQSTIVNGNLVYHIPVAEHLYYGMFDLQSGVICSNKQVKSTLRSNCLFFFKCYIKTLTCKGFFQNTPLGKKVKQCAFFCLFCFFF